MSSSWDSLVGLKGEPVKLSAPTLAALARCGFDAPLPVQQRCVPLLLTYKDVAAEAVTGSGKSLAFLIPALELLRRRAATEPWRAHELGALVLTPTAELAWQIGEVLDRLLAGDESLDASLRLHKALLLRGGGALSAEIRRVLAGGVQILVATPGRLVDLLGQEAVGAQLARGFKSLELLVLDEADRLLDMGFHAQLNSVLAVMPKQRRTGLFSATQTKEVRALMRAGLRNPHLVRVTEVPSVAPGDAASDDDSDEEVKADRRTPAALENQFSVVPEEARLAFLLSFLRARRRQKALIFLATCESVNYFQLVLSRLDPALRLLKTHGQLRDKRRDGPTKRQRVFMAFRALKSGALLTTNCLARGVDFPDIDWVLQVDPPSRAEDFVHRCGRTARLGRPGRALILLAPSERDYASFLAINQQTTLTEAPLPAGLDADKVCAAVRALAAKDKHVYDKGKPAFVSFVRYYSQHDCHLIFRAKELRLGRLATGFGLLRLPRMPEVKAASAAALEGFTASDLDIDALPYATKSIAVQRRKQAVEREAEWEERKARQAQHVKTTAWSEANSRRDKRKLRKAGKRSRAAAAAAAAAGEEVDEAAACAAEEDDEMEMARDMRLMKRLKKGKVSAQDFNQQFLPADARPDV